MKIEKICKNTVFVNMILCLFLGSATVFAQEKEEADVVSSAIKEEYKMEPIVRIVKINPIRIAVCNRISKSPEQDSYNALRAWAEPKGLLDDPVKYPIFGRNNPDPSPDKEEYGYDFMLAIPADMKIDGEMKEGEVPGGTYAVVRTRFKTITDMWFWLYNWTKEKGYKATGHGYEEHIIGVDIKQPSNMLFDLWLGVSE